MARRFVKVDSVAQQTRIASETALCPWSATTALVPRVVRKTFNVTATPSVTFVTRYLIQLDFAPISLTTFTCSLLVDAKRTLKSVAATRMKSATTWKCADTTSVYPSLVDISETVQNVTFVAKTKRLARQRRLITTARKRKSIMASATASRAATLTLIAWALTKFAEIECA